LISPPKNCRVSRASFPGHPVYSFPVTTRKPVGWAERPYFVLSRSGGLSIGRADALLCKVEIVGAL